MVEKEEEKRIIGAIAAGGIGISLLYLLMKKVKAAPPPKKWIEVTDFEVVSAEE